MINNLNIKVWLNENDILSVVVDRFRLMDIFNLFSSVSYNNFSFLSSNFSYLNLSFPVLCTVLQFNRDILLINELKWIRHICDLSLKLLLLLNLESYLCDVFFREFNIFFGLFIFNLFHMHVLRLHILLLNGILQLFLQKV